MRWALSILVLSLLAVGQLVGAEPEFFKAKGVSKRLEESWDFFGTRGASPAADIAFWRMVSAPEATLSFLKNRLLPVEEISPQRLKQLLMELDSESFSTRQQATQELQARGESAEAAVRELLESGPPLEVQTRIEGILQELETEKSRRNRGITVLEFIGSEEAKQLLSQLAGGMPAASTTRAATAALKRLTTGTRPEPSVPFDGLMPRP